MEHVTAGINGAELIRRRVDGLCIACGLVAVVRRAADGEQPLLCPRCDEARKTRVKAQKDAARTI